jgi:D-inositol-3-phosphate glycosyltransferase
MRIAMVSEHASPLAVLGGVDAGGQNVHVAAVATALGRRGEEVDVYTRRDDAALPAAVAMAPRVRVVHVDAGPARPLPKDRLLPFMDGFADELARAWERERPDVVHAHFWMSGLAALAAARPLGIPVVQTFHALGVVKRRHQGAADTSPPGRIDAERAVVRAVDGIIATCSDEVFELRRLGADLGRVRIVPCGVDLRLFGTDGPVAPRRPGLRRLVIVSRLVARKGIRDAVRALAAVPEAELVVAGGPPAAQLARDAEAVQLRELAGELGVGDRLVLLGSVARGEVPALLRSADAVVCVPWYEPFGIVPLEAMACGVPVIASSVGGLVDTVVDGVTGLHVPPRRADRIAAAALTLLGDEELRRELGAAGLRRARSRYGWERIARATLSCYHELTAERTAVGGEVGM